MTTSEQKQFAEAVQIVAGNPTEQELVALIAVLQEASKQQRVSQQTQLSTWAKNEQLLRTRLVAGTGQWISAYRQGI